MKPRIKNTVILNGKRYVCRIYDAGDKFVDHYTIAFKGYYLPGYGMIYPYLSSSDAPYHPGGVGLHGESRTFMKGRHLGKRVRFEELPAQVREFITDNIAR
jgi:hypothetical protein